RRFVLNLSRQSQLRAMRLRRRPRQPRHRARHAGAVKRSWLIRPPRNPVPRLAPNRRASSLMADRLAMTAPRDGPDAPPVSARTAPRVAGRARGKISPSVPVRSPGPVRVSPARARTEPASAPILQGRGGWPSTTLGAMGPPVVDTGLGDRLTLIGRP